jgi:chromosome segregation ATPase
MNRREIRSTTTSPPPSSLRWRRNDLVVISQHTTTTNRRRRHLADQRQQHFEEQRSRTVSPLINTLDLLPKEEKQSFDKDNNVVLFREDEVVRNHPDTRNFDVRKKLNEAALSEAMAGPGRNHRKQQVNTNAVMVQGFTSTSSPRYGSRSIRAQQNMNETVEATLGQSRPQQLRSTLAGGAPGVKRNDPPRTVVTQEVSLTKLSNLTNPASSDNNTVHTVPTSDDEISTEESSSGTSSIELVKQTEERSNAVKVIGMDSLDHHIGAVANNEIMKSKAEIECLQKEKAKEIEAKEKEIESLRGIIEALQLNQTNCENNLKAAIVENKRAQAKIQEADETKKAQQEVINELKKNLSSAKSNLNCKEKMMVDLQTQAAQAMSAYKERVTSKIKSQESQIEEMTSLYSKLQFQYNKCTFETRNNDDGKMSALSKEIARLEDQVSNKAAENAALAIDVERLERELRECKEELDRQLTAERGLRLDTQSLLERRICDKDKQINQLNTDLSAALSDSRKLQSKIDTMIITSDASSAELSSLKNWKINAEKVLVENKDKDKQINQLSNDLSAALSDSRKLQSKIDAMMITSDASSAELSSLKKWKINAEKVLDENEDKDKQINQLSNDLSAALSASRKLQSKVDTMMITSEASSAELSSLKKWKINAEKVLFENEDKDKQINQLSNDLSAALSDSRKLQSKVDAMMITSEASSAELSSLKNWKINAEKVLFENEDKDKQINQLSNDLSAALSDSRKLQSKVDAMMITSEASSAELSSLKKWKINAEKVLDENENKVDEMKSIISNLTSKCDFYETTIQQNDDEIFSLTGQLKERDNFIAAKDAEIAKLQNDAEDRKKSNVKELATLREAISTAEASLIEKAVIISTLSSNTKRLEAELEECKQFYAKKLMEAQTPKLESSRQMERNLRTKEVELELLKVALRRSKAECTKMSSMVDPMSSKIAELKAWKKSAQERMHNQQEEHKKFVEDKIDCISTLEQRLQASEYQATMRYEVELLKICRERDELKSEVESKNVEINGIKAEMDECMHEMNSLRDWKDEAISNLAMKEREVMVLEIAARRNLDFENELERQRMKYQKARTALHSMEKALHAVGLERKRLIGNAKEVDDDYEEEGVVVGIEPWGK